MAEGGDLSNRRKRSRPSIKLKEEASESEASRMIKLKKEWCALLDRKTARIEAEAKALDAREKALQERVKARLAGAPIPPPPQCDLPSLLVPVVALPPPAGAGSSETNKKTKKKVVKRKVPQVHIDHMIRTLHDPYKADYHLNRLRNRNQELLEFFAELRALAEKKFEYRQSIIKQFYQKGYAEDYSETDDDEAEDDN
ncbi:hypothetical protein HU200_030536 [Digitaria exilis]|uniref:Uncharacterized protein n=1 Tax=Digitaria exilis TaxID=1010633 RepID=A0A835EQS1_9POAL|nr:hypothetical protein HU200_030536 [Digitaria exilis]